jgi:hypothetical protein
MDSKKQQILDCQKEISRLQKIKKNLENEERERKIQIEMSQLQEDIQKERELASKCINVWDNEEDWKSKKSAKALNEKNEWKIIRISNRCKQSKPCKHDVYFKNKITNQYYSRMLGGHQICDWLLNGFAKKEVLENNHFIKYQDKIKIV